MAGGTRSRTSVALVLGLLSALSLSGFATAQNLPTRADYTTWLAKYAQARPSFKPGDVLTSKDVERIRPFVPPGYLEQLDFPEVRMEIGPPQDHTPRTDFMECTEKYVSQVRLGPAGDLQNYICGQPFMISEERSSDPLAGIEAAWNFEYRWQNFGFAVYSVPWIWVSFGGTHPPVEIEKPPVNWDTSTGFNVPLPTTAETAEMFAGGGSFQRMLQSTYQRVYFNHLAQLMNEQHGVLPVPNAKMFEFKDFLGFFDPFDVRGAAFIIYRYNDPLRADDAWAYIPNLRHVRRISVEVKSDSVLGTDLTLEDFFGFSGRVLEWHWKFLGWKDALAVMNSKYDNAHYFGPNGIIPNDRWTMRRYAVVERTPIRSGHPYSSAIELLDTQNWDCAYLITFDHTQRVWKIFQFSEAWSEDLKESALQRINRGIHASHTQGVAAMDLQNRRATLFATYGGGFPNLTGQHVSSIFDPSSLEQTHR